MCSLFAGCYSSHDWGLITGCNVFVVLYAEILFRRCVCPSELNGSKHVFMTLDWRPPRRQP